MKNISKPLDVIETNYDDAFNNPPTTTDYDEVYKGNGQQDPNPNDRYNSLKNIYKSVTPVVGSTGIYPVFALAFKDDDAEGMKLVKAEYDGYITLSK